MKSNLRPQIITRQLAFGRTGVRQWKQSMTTHMHTVSEREKSVKERGTERKRGKTEKVEVQRELDSDAVLHPGRQTSGT